MYDFQIAKVQPQGAAQRGHAYKSVAHKKACKGFQQLVFFGREHSFIDVQVDSKYFFE